MDSKLENEFLKHLESSNRIIYKICFIYCRNRSDISDMYQEIVLQLWKSYPGFKGKSAISTWVYRVALNTAITHIRKPAIIVDTEEVPEIACDYESIADLSEDTRLLYKAISKLDRIEKAIILLWLEDRSYKEISETTGISVKNVSVKITRIKVKLANILKNLH
ncbi:MAG TPA: RNA polymerase sigma factor [Bacteroidales bacterium]|nr:RNA polymerase sigma factor [Bacteroidales bacterium]